MKFNIEVEMTPEELRRLAGLPDVSGLQQEMLNKISEKMAQGIEGFDAANLLKPYLPEHLQSLTAMQKVFWENLLKSTPGAATTERAPSEEK